MFGPDFIQTKRMQSITNSIDEYKFFIGHHRAATYGKITSENAHPFNVGDITLVHNGTVFSTRTYHKDHNEFQVDSELIAHSINVDGYKEALSNLNGGAAIVWYDKKEDTLNLFRNSERPLYFVKVKNSTTSYIASELYMLKWLLIRNDIAMEGLFEIKENTVCVFTDSATVDSVEEIPKKKVITYSHNNNLTNAEKYNKWEKPHKNTISEALENARVEMGDVVEFQYETIHFNNAKSRHGTIQGTCLKYPYFTVICYNIDPRKLQGASSFKGTVSGVKLHETLNTYEIIVKDLKYEFKNSIENEEGLVQGPHNSKITKKEFNNLVKHGCSNCQVGLMPSIADSIVWPDRQTPICSSCAVKLGTRPESQAASSFH